MAEKPPNIDQYLAAVPDDQRAALENLRKLIRAAAPEAEECISYGIPAFRQNGMLVGFHATKNHCAFFLMSGSTVAQFAELLAPYDTSKGTIRFLPDQPLPAALVRQLVEVRLAENAARAATKSKSKSGSKTSKKAAPITAKSSKSVKSVKSVKTVESPGVKPIAKKHAKKSAQRAKLPAAKPKAAPKKSPRR